MGSEMCIRDSGVASPQVVPAATVTTDAKPHGQHQLACDLEVERAVMGQRCRPQSLGEVQRCNPLCFLLTAAQYCCSWASFTDQLVRKLKKGLGISMAMKKFFIFLPVQTMKKIFLFVPVQQYKHHVRSIARSGVPPGGARSDGHH